MRTHLTHFVRSLRSLEQQDLRSKIQVLENELQALQEFKRQKTKIESELRRTKFELSEAKQYHKSEIARLDRRNVQEKEKLKKEMLLKIKETKQSLLHMTEDQLHTTTKRTIMENEQMTTELQYQSKETEKVLTRIAKTIAKNKKLEREIMLLKDKDAEYARKTHFYQKLIKKLHYQIQSREKLSIESENRATQDLEQHVGDVKRESKLQLEALSVGFVLRWGGVGLDGWTLLSGTHSTRKGNVAHHPSPNPPYSTTPPPGKSTAARNLAWACGEPDQGRK